MRRCEPLVEDSRIASDPDPESCAALAELRRELAAQLASISVDQARVVVLKDALDYSFAEISSAAGMPVGTAKCYAHRGRNSLRARLRAAGA
jgi:DNA-directed RNA polymerase specialized sigma24 family protein